jgi:hypothetical protein
LRPPASAARVFDSRGRSVERKVPQRVAPFSLPGRPDHLAAPAGDPTRTFFNGE